MHNWRPELWASRELAARIHSVGYAADVTNYKAKWAQRWRFDDGAGEVGFISSYRKPFLRACTGRAVSEGKSILLVTQPTVSICARRCAPAPTTRMCCD